MTQILGHNYIGGQRSAAGSVKLHSVDASTGEALPHDFIQATAEEVDAAAKAPLRLTRPIAASAPNVARSSSMRSRMSWMRLATISLLWSAAKPRCRPDAFRASAVAPAGRCVCSPKSCVVVISTAHGSIRHCRIASRCHVRICVSTASASARSRCSARATSRWRSPLPVAIPQQHWPPVARWFSRRTAATWPPLNWSPTRSFVPQKNRYARWRVQHDLRWRRR